MIVITKKRLLTITGLICCSLTLFAIKGSMNKPETVATVNLPVSNKVIVLDAGHRCSRRTVHKVVMEFLKLKLI